jgi:hypothetical protein
MASQKNIKYKEDQQKARESLKPKVTKGYLYNPLPNRAERRKQARAKNQSAWKEANQQWSSLNKQTSNSKEVIHEEEQATGAPDGNK